MIFPCSSFRGLSAARITLLIVSGLTLAACQPFSPSRTAVLNAGAVPAGPTDQGG
jgi:hypothetical protein